MEAWSIDTTKKEEKENQEKKEKGIVVPYEGLRDYQGDSYRIGNSKVHILGEGVIASAH